MPGINSRSGTRSEPSHCIPNARAKSRPKKSLHPPAGKTSSSDICCVKNKRAVFDTLFPQEFQKNWVDFIRLFEVGDMPAIFNCMKFNVWDCGSQRVTVLEWHRGVMASPE